MIASVIPLSLGDNLRGLRIVGTSHAYTDHYGATLAQGRRWDAPMQVLVGSTVAKKLGIQVGNTFVGSHGLCAFVADQDCTRGHFEKQRCQTSLCSYCACHRKNKVRDCLAKSLACASSAALPDSAAFCAIAAMRPPVIMKAS
jgi:hypothetical protein